MNKSISLEKVQQDAEQLFREGKFFCSEAIIASIRENIDPEMPESIISVASGFPVGVGRSKCMCGAVSGGIIALGYFFGRTKPNGSEVNNTLLLANELQAHFRENHKVLCCSVHTKGLDMANGEHKDQCVAFTGEMAYKTAEIIAREFKLEVI